MRGSRKKCEKPPFFVTLGQKGPFWTVFGQNGQNGQNGENYQKSAWNIFPNFLNPHIKFQKKVMNGFREKASRTDGRTNGRTNATPKVSNDQLVERPKIVVPIFL